MRGLLVVLWPEEYSPVRWWGRRGGEWPGRARIDQAMIHRRPSTTPAWEQQGNSLPRVPQIVLSRVATLAS